ncbi:MAG: GNAT family N-acetyltransferase [Candidatus Gastranaerophilales bacterium]|nr:GNAT family N-acetyltransferase [Candidatus Gastranaerophilales bacterium]
MANITIYKTESYNSNYFRIFSGVYNDFKTNAAKDYNFELEPLAYPNFIKSIENGLLKCLILFEDDIPTGFLAYTTVISESLELNIIHCIGSENINAKRKLLLEKFIETNRYLMKEKVITYPLMGKQSSFSQDIQMFGFKIVNTSVMGFNFTDVTSINKTKEVFIPDLPHNYLVTNWNNIYFKDAVNVIHQAFKESSDALFDSRFKTQKGCSDILEKITNSIYGKFLPEITKVLLYKKTPVGFCFVNLTNNKIANIPIAAILKKHRNNGYGKMLLKKAVDDLLNSAISEGRELRELNASCDSDNFAAVRMYDSVGFIEEYRYPLAYHPKIM